MSLNVFWFLPTSGDGRYLGKSSSARSATISYNKQVATVAEEMGYDGLLIPTGSSNLDSIVTAASLANVTDRIKMLVAVRTFSVGGPTAFARQVATLDQALNGRLLINVVAGAWKEELAADGIFWDHDERYEATEEFLKVYKKLFTEQSVGFKGKYYHIDNAYHFIPSVQKPYPPLFFGGSSDAAIELAANHIETYLTWGEPPHLVAEKINQVRAKAAERGRSIKFGIRLHVIVRETNDEAWAAAGKLIRNLDPEIIKKSVENQRKMDSVGQSRMTSLHNGDISNLEISPNLWSGVGLVRGGAGTSLVGDPETVAERIKEYADLGIDTFILSGYPHLEESIRFAELVFPLLPRKTPMINTSGFVTGGAFDLHTLKEYKPSSKV